MGTALCNLPRYRLSFTLPADRTRRACSRSMVKTVLGDSQAGAARCLGRFGRFDLKALPRLGSASAGAPRRLGNPGASADEFVGSVDLPNEPFRVYARGRMQNGSSSFRASGDLRHADCPSRPVVAGSTPLGATTAVQIEVRIIWSRRLVSFTAATMRHFVSGVAPSNCSSVRCIGCYGGQPYSYCEYRCRSILSQWWLAVRRTSCQQQRTDRASDWHSRS